MPDGTPAADAELPDADFHILIYRSDDCDRCNRLERELQRVIGSRRNGKFAWITIDSDPGSILAAP